MVLPVWAVAINATDSSIWIPGQTRGFHARKVQRFFQQSAPERNGQCDELISLDTQVILLPGQDLVREHRTMELDGIVLVPEKGGLGRERFDDPGVEAFQDRQDLKPDPVSGIHGLRVRRIGHECESRLPQVFQHLVTRDFR